MIVDASGSMREPFGGSTRIESAKRGAEQMIRSLPQDVNIGLIDFSACNQIRRDKYYTGPERGALIGEINGLQPKQGTPLGAAIEQAGKRARTIGDSVLIVVSDGADSCGRDPCAEARKARAAKPNLVINVIDLSGGGSDRQVLQCVASAGGGRLLSPGDPIDLNRKMQEAAGSANCVPEK